MLKFVLLMVLSVFLLTRCNDNQDNISENTTIENTDYSSTRTSTNSTSDEKSNNKIVEKKENATSDLKKEYDLADAGTTIYVKEKGRQNNISITCSSLNGATVNPGNTFSFCDTVGKATSSKGYEEADVFDSDGNVIQALGGGNCQVSSTLYNAVLQVPGLEVVERHPHSRKVTYVEEGKDAAVAYGSVDFRFKNNLKNTVKIYASNDPDGIYIRLVEIK